MRLLPRLIALLLIATPTTAFAVSGTLTPEYGAPLASQSTQSNYSFSTPFPAQNNSRATELDNAYAYVSGGTLYLFLSGTLTFTWAGEGNTVGMPLDVFIDCAPGGQHQLLANNPTLASHFDLKKLAGLTFDEGFAPDYWLGCGANDFWPNVQAYFAALPSDGGDAGAFLGWTPTGPPGVLTQGTNPNNIQVTLDDSNTTPLGTGCGSAVAPAVTTGVEWAIPLAALGNPTGCIQISAFVGCADQSCITNQVFGPIGPGFCSMLPAATLDFSAIAGNQYFDVCDPSPVHGSSWGGVKAIYR